MEKKRSAQSKDGRILPRWMTDEDIAVPKLAPEQEAASVVRLMDGDKIPELEMDDFLDIALPGPSLSRDYGGSLRLGTHRPTRPAQDDRADQVQGDPDPVVVPMPVMVDGIRRNPEFKFDVDAWRNEVWQPQFDYWENQFKPNGLLSGPFPKWELFEWATLHLLLLPIMKKAPTLWPVYCYLLVTSPDGFTTFKLSSKGLAQGAGVSERSARDAVDYLRELKFVSAKKGLWTPRGPKAAVLPSYRITSLEQLKSHCQAA